MAAPDVHKVAYVFFVLLYSLCLLLPFASRRSVFERGISKHRSMQYFHGWLSWTRNQSDWWLPVVVLKLWSVSLGMTHDMVVGGGGRSGFLQWTPGQKHPLVLHMTENAYTAPCLSVCLYDEAIQPISTYERSVTFWVAPGKHYILVIILKVTQSDFV